MHAILRVGHGCFKFEGLAKVAPASFMRSTGGLDSVSVIESLLMCQSRGFENPTIHETAKSEVVVCDRVGFRCDSVWLGSIDIKWHASTVWPRHDVFRILANGLIDDWVLIMTLGNFGMAVIASKVKKWRHSLQRTYIKYGMTAFDVETCCSELWKKWWKKGQRLTRRVRAEYKMKERTDWIN